MITPNPKLNRLQACVLTGAATFGSSYAVLVEFLHVLGGATIAAVIGLAVTLYVSRLSDSTIVKLGSWREAGAASIIIIGICAVFLTGVWKYVETVFQPDTEAELIPTATPRLATYAELEYLKVKVNELDDMGVPPDKVKPLLDMLDRSPEFATQEDLNETVGQVVNAIRGFEDQGYITAAEFDSLMTDFMAAYVESDAFVDAVGTAVARINSTQQVGDCWVWTDLHSVTVHSMPYLNSGWAANKYLMQFDRKRAIHRSNGDMNVTLWWQIVTGVDQYGNELWGWVASSGVEESSVVGCMNLPITEQIQFP